MAFTGFGVNAAQDKLAEQQNRYNVYCGYNEYNFHNQYLQTFAGIGHFGFLIVCGMLLLLFQNYRKQKELMALFLGLVLFSIFLTETYIWRQRGMIHFFSAVSLAFQNYSIPKDRIMKLLVDAHVLMRAFRVLELTLKGLYIEMVRLKPDWHFLAAHNLENLRQEFGTAPNITFLKLQHQNKYLRLLYELPRLLKKASIRLRAFSIHHAHFKGIQNTSLPPTIFCLKRKRFASYFPLKYQLNEWIPFQTFRKRAEILLTVSNYSKSTIGKILSHS